MKKVLSLAVACLFLFAFAGCSPSSETEIPSDAEKPSDTETEVPSDPGADNPPETEEPSDAETFTYTVEEKSCTRRTEYLRKTLYSGRGGRKARRHSLAQLLSDACLDE